MTTSKVLLCIALAGLATSCTDDGSAAIQDEPLGSDTSEIVVPRTQQPLPGYANQMDPTALDPTSLDELSGCLTFANFTQSGLSPAWDALLAQGQTCANCHAGSTPMGFLPPINDAQAFFDLVSEHRAPLGAYYLPTPATIELNEGSYGLFAGAPPHVEHPHANLTTVHAAATQLLDLSLQRARAGLCGPSTLVD